MPLPRRFPWLRPTLRGLVALRWVNHIGAIAVEGRIISGDCPSTISALGRPTLERRVLPGTEHDSCKVLAHQWPRTPGGPQNPHYRIKRGRLGQNIGRLQYPSWIKLCKINQRLVEEVLGFYAFRARTPD